MSKDLSPYDEDLIFLRAEFAKWWKIPTIEQEEMFCELVAKMVADDEFSEIEARKIALDKIIYG